MKLTVDQRRKIGDDETLKAFEEAAAAEQLRVVFTLKVDEEGANTPRVMQVGPNATLEDRTQYRQRLINSRKALLNDQIREILDQLAQNSLETKGGSSRILKHIVVDGSAKNILKSLELDGIARARISRQRPIG